MENSLATTAKDPMTLIYWLPVRWGSLGMAQHVLDKKSLPVDSACHRSWVTCSTASGSVLVKSYQTLHNLHTCPYCSYLASGSWGLIPIKSCAKNPNVVKPIINQPLTLPSTNSYKLSINPAIGGLSLGLSHEFP